MVTPPCKWIRGREEDNEINSTNRIEFTRLENRKEEKRQVNRNHGVGRKRRISRQMDFTEESWSSLPALHDSYLKSQGSALEVPGMFNV